MIVTRFAPSPSGRLHLGHAASALFAYEKAKASQGRFILRIEDIDQERCKLEFTTGIYEDLSWLGLSWERPVRIQSDHFEEYEKALSFLKEEGLLYPCFCTRREIEEAVQAPHENAQTFYPGTCRNLTAEQKEERSKERGAAWRLDVEKACQRVGPITWHDEGKGDVKAHPEKFGDVVLARKDCPTSYHLSVTLDDAVQSITHVTRGCDLFEVTDIHVLLQKLLSLPQPVYHHHPLLTDEEGKRFAKRDFAKTIQAMREEGMSPEEVRALAADGFTSANRA